MRAMIVERQRRDAGHGVERQRAIKVRKQRPAARDLPFQRIAQTSGVDSNQQQIGLTCEMFRRRLPRLFGGGEMNIAVGEIDRRARKDARRFRRAPFRRRDDL